MRGSPGVGRWAARLGVVALAGMVAIAAGASRADAHTRAAETGNVVSRITDDPTPEGIEVRVHVGGLLVELVNHTGSPVIVHGYDGEPYLRISADRVEANRRSPATHLNRARYGDVAMPPDVDPRAPPEWIVIGDGPRAIWHDHRTHWMSPAPPPFVDAGPVRRALMRMEFVGPVGRAGDDAGVFQAWQLPLTHDGHTVVVSGELLWRDAPSSTGWFVVSLVALAAAFVRVPRDDPDALVRRAALVVGAIALVNAIHLVDDLVALPTDLLDRLFGVLHTTFFLSLGVAGAWWAHRADVAKVLALGIGSGAVLYHQGIVHLPMLMAAEFPSIWPDGLARLTVALGLVQAPVVTVVIASCLRRRAHELTG